MGTRQKELRDRIILPANDIVSTFHNMIDVLLEYEDRIEELEQILDYNEIKG